MQSYAAAHSKDTSGALAQLALGVVAYEHKDYPAAIAALRKVQKLPQIADYTAWYLAASRVESNDFAGIANDLAPTHTTPLLSPLSAKAWLLEARALETTQPAEGARILRELYAELPQPEGDLTLADCYRPPTTWFMPRNPTSASTINTPPAPPPRAPEPLCWRSKIPWATPIRRRFPA